MMEGNFDFDKVGKQMPYKVPSNFFDKVTKDTLAEAERRSGFKKQPSRSLWKALSVAASLVILLTIGYIVYNSRTTSNSNTIAATQDKVSEGVSAEYEKLPVIETPASSETVNTAVQNKPAIASTPNPAAPAEEPQPNQTSKKDKPETLDDVLKSLSDEDLLLLAAKAEADLHVYEQTFY